MCNRSCISHWMLVCLALQNSVQANSLIKFSFRLRLHRKLRRSCNYCIQQMMDWINCGIKYKVKVLYCSSLSLTKQYLVHILPINWNQMLNGMRKQKRIRMIKQMRKIVHSYLVLLRRKFMVYKKIKDSKLFIVSP